MAGFLIEMAFMFSESSAFEETEEDTLLQLIFDAKTLMKLFPHDRWKDLIAKLEQKVPQNLRLMD
jgi:hypothetical protein